MRRRAALERALEHARHLLADDRAHRAAHELEHEEARPATGCPSMRARARADASPVPACAPRRAQPIDVALRVAEAQRVDALDRARPPRRSCRRRASARCAAAVDIGKWCSHCGQTSRFFSRSAVSSVARQPGHFVNTPAGTLRFSLGRLVVSFVSLVPGHGRFGAAAYHRPGQRPQKTARGKLDCPGSTRKRENRSRNLPLRRSSVLLCCGPCISAPGIPSWRRSWWSNEARTPGPGSRWTRTWSVPASTRSRTSSWTT